MVDPAEMRHAEQAAYWNGVGGTHWAVQQTRIERVLSPVADLVIQAASPRPGDRIIDIGCGSGATTEVLARAVGDVGRVTGLDVSAPLVAQASARLAAMSQARVILGDAASIALEPGSIDLLFSRFGVMFFGDPTVAFRNLRGAVRPGGRVCFACWRAPSLNPWMMLPLSIAYACVPRLPKPGPDDPGPFSFADPDRVTRILSEAGFTDIGFTPHDVLFDISAGEGVAGAVAYTLEIGATSRALDGHPESVRQKVADDLRAAFTALATKDGVFLAGAIWIVTATAP